MRKLVEIARAGLDGLRLHPLRSAVTVACVLAVLVPYLVGLGVSHAVRRQAEISILYGADLYVRGAPFGRPGPVPVELAERIQALDGVTGVVPRIIAEVHLGRNREPAVLVGLEPERFQDVVRCIRGRMPTDETPNELVIGTELARRMQFDVGAKLPPFYHSRKGERISTVVGVFQSDVSLWQANLILTTFASAAAMFDQPGWATDLAVYCRPQYERNVATAIAGGEDQWQTKAGVTPLGITRREELLATLPRGLLHREGIFNLHFVLAFAVGIPLVLVTSGIGLPERRREIGILKAIGWQTDEVLLRGLVESFCLSLLAGSLAVLLAFIWLRGFNGYGIAALFLPGVAASPSFPIPFQLTPLPALLTLLLSFAVVMTGTTLSTWRTAVTPPIEAMR